MIHNFEAKCSKNNINNFNFQGIALFENRFRRKVFIAKGFSF